jgi:hypothetical protein
MDGSYPEDATPVSPDWRWVDTEHGRRLRDANNFDSDVIVPTGDGGFMVDPEQERVIAVAPRMVGLLDALASLALAFAMQDDSGYAGKPEEYPLYKEIEAIRADLEGPGGASPAAEPKATRTTAVGPDGAIWGWES